MRYEYSQDQKIIELYELPIIVIYEEWNDEAIYYYPYYQHKRKIAALRSQWRLG